MKRSLIVSAMAMLICSIFYVFGAFAADVPKTLNYQGTLADNTGQPVTGTKQIAFKLYNVASGGTALWTETQTVTVTNGRFSVVLGSITPLNASVFTGETYLGIKVGTDAEMAPRQKLTSVGYAFKALEVVNLPNIPDPIPSGIIVMWSGSSANIPQGWALCNGSNGTPNLRDRFIIGAGSAYSVGGTGGEATHTLTITEMPSHLHIQDAHTHIQNEHTHPYAVANDTVGEGYPGGGDSQNLEKHTSDPTTATNNNATAINQNTGGGAAHNNLPPYYALCFIMKL